MTAPGPRPDRACPSLSIAIRSWVSSTHTWGVIGGALLWGAALGIQESTLRAVVADLVAPARRASAYTVSTPPSERRHRRHRGHRRGVPLRHSFDY